MTVPTQPLGPPDDDDQSSEHSDKVGDPSNSSNSDEDSDEFTDLLHPPDNSEGLDDSDDSDVYVLVQALQYELDLISLATVPSRLEFLTNWVLFLQLRGCDSSRGAGRSYGYHRGERRPESI